MARKKAKPEMPATVEPSVITKPVRLDLPPDVHRLLRLVAAHHDQSMATCARDAVERFVREESRRLGIKP